MVKLGNLAQTIEDDRFSTETKRLAIKDVEDGMSRLAVAMKYKVNVGELLKWLNDRERIRDNKCALADRKRVAQRLAIKKARLEKPCMLPRANLSEVPKPRIVPMEEIMKRIKKEHDDKEKKKIDIFEKQARARVKSSAAARADLRRERGRAPPSFQMDKLETIDDSSEEIDTYVPRIRMNYNHIMFDDQYFTYKTMFTRDEDVIEIWAKDQVVTRPNVFFNAHQFIQNAPKDSPNIEVEKELFSSEESFSEWSESKKEKAYERLRNVDLYLSNSEELSSKDDLSGFESLSSLANSSDNMIEMTVSIHSENDGRLSDDSEENEITDNEDSKSQAIACDISLPDAITEEETIDKVNEILEDKNMWSALSTEMIHELHTTGSLPDVMEKEQSVEDIQPDKIVAKKPVNKVVRTRKAKDIKKPSIIDEEMDTSTIDQLPEMDIKQKAAAKIKKHRGKKQIEILNDDIPEITPTETLEDKLQDSDTEPIRKTRGRAKKEIEHIDKVADKIAPPKKGRAKKVVEINEEMVIDDKIAPPKKGRAKKIVEINEEMVIDDKIAPTKKGRAKKVIKENEEIEPTKVVNTREIKVPTRSTRSKKEVDYIEENVQCKGRECKKKNVKNAKKGLNESTRVSSLYQDLSCDTPRNVSNRNADDFEIGL